MHHPGGGKPANAAILAQRFEYDIDNRTVKSVALDDASAAYPQEFSRSAEKYFLNKTLQLFLHLTPLIVQIAPFRIPTSLLQILCLRISN